MTKLYLDTNIFIYTHEKSKNLFGKDISSSSAKLIFDAISCKYHLIISDWTLEELGKIRDIKNFDIILKLIQKKKISISYTEEDMEKAKQDNRTHFHDELHGILALKSNADYLVTRNKKDFLHFRDKIKLVKPEELI